MHLLPRPLYLLCLLLALVVQPALAEQDDLFSVRVAVADQSAPARQQALREGLRRVMVKLTGHSSIGADVLPRSGLELEDYVSEYLYQPPLDPDYHETGLDLVARFMPGTVNRLVRDLGLPRWPTNRPRVLVWVLAESDEGPRFVNPARIPQLDTALKETFRDRAVPMRQPMLDLEDQFALPADDAWGRDQELLAEASRRYGATTVLLLRLVPPADMQAVLARSELGGELLPPGTPPEEVPADSDEPWWVGEQAESAEDVGAEIDGEWRGDWMLLSDGSVFTDAMAMDSLGGVVAAGIDDAVDALARLHAYLPSDGEAMVEMELRELLTFEDFRRAEAMIREMEMVSGIKLLSLERDRARFELALEGSREVLLQSLRNSEHFESLVDEAVGAGVDRPRHIDSPQDADFPPGTDWPPNLDLLRPSLPLLFSWVP